jgi:feruloyl esterase
MCSYFTRQVKVTDTNLYPQVHKGYYRQWKSIQDQAKSAVQQALQQWPLYKLYVTGHSMGAGIACIAGVGLYDAGMNNTVFTYGEPRTGNPAFATYIDQKIGGMFRVTHGGDSICQIPPASYRNGSTTYEYRHHSTEYHAVDPASPANTKKCSGSEDRVSSFDHEVDLTRWIRG